MILLSYLLCVLNGANAQPSDPLRINYESVRALMDRPDPAERFTLRQRTLDGPGSTFVYLEDEPSPPSAALRTLAAKLHADQGFQLVYLKHLDGVHVPSFDGVVIDGQGNVIANFAIGKLGQSIAHKRIFTRGLRLLDAHAHSDAWVSSLLHRARRLAGQPPSSRVEEVTFEHRGQFTALEEFARAYRLHRAVFAVGTGRPTYFLMQADHWNKKARRNLEGMLPARSSITRVYLSFDDQLLDLTSTCRTDLGPAD